MENYLIREFYGEEVIPYKKLSTVMFRSKNEQLSDEDAYKEILKKEDLNREPDFFRLGAFYEEKLYAAIEVYGFNANFDGTPCKMSGIGGVISDFNSPLKGAMKQIYAESFKIMRAKGQYISHLYPFEENYYRQYGYDVTCQSETWKIPIEKLCIYKEGIAVPYDGTDKMKEDVKSVFNKFAADKNLLITRNDKEWEAFFESKKPYVSGVNAFVHYNESGSADAYMSYSVSPQADRPQNMVVNSLWFTDFNGLKGILSYFATQRSYCDHLLITLPESIDIAPVLDSCGGWGKRNVVRTVLNQGTTRVIDVEEVLKMAKYNGEGKICIKIYDDIYAPWNNDCFTVEFGKETKVSRGGAPDIEMKITSFTTGIMGRMSFENLLIFPDIKVINKDNLEKVFYKKHVWIEGHF
ncbi:MAG: GNAT family N-acetyltransferase [Clostridia bacterium]|nr:GNAT family N-acetyltransferase [Clostridia bacterium]